MKAALGFLPFVLFAAVASSAQDLEVRREAIQLLEKTSALSLSPNLPNLERVDTFRILDTSSPVREGTFTRVVVQGTGSREETTFGDYHAIEVWTHENVASVRTNALDPAEVDTVRRLTPIELLRFDEEDVIHAIVDKAAGGRKLRCIEFDTIRGQKLENNEFCVDTANGTLVSEKIGEELIENSEFFPFAGELIPAKIAYSFGGVRKLEISQTITELTEATENVLTAPPNAQNFRFCKTHRRAIGVSMPQPKPGNSGRDSDVVIRGIIESDGKVHEAVVQSAERADLGAEALGLIRQWVFTPMMCEGNPGSIGASFVLHFQGR
jgi:hypothetical protein